MTSTDDLNLNAPLEERSTAPTFPIEEYKKANRDVEAEVDNDLGTPSEDDLKSDATDVDGGRGWAEQAVRDRALEFSLRLHKGKEYRTVSELVADAKVIWKFLTDNEA